MPGNHNYQGHQLPTYPEHDSGNTATGIVTPASDRMPDLMSIPPKRVLPIIFLPGIMGSNLRLKVDRQKKLQHDNNIAWRPDNKREMEKLINAGARVRQLQLDPDATEVDEYDPVNNITGDKHENSDQRNENVEVKYPYSLDVSINTPLLMDDPMTNKPRKTKEQKARERGWGEVYFKSYREVLERCELHLNTAFHRGVLDVWWKQIVDVDPAQWQASPQSVLKPLDEKTLKEVVKGCWFPVHAMGYNWLQSNSDSSLYIAKRITALMARYEAQGFTCEKVIVVTHSMGGLVARALVHPDMGNLKEKVLGIVYGEMPAIGAAATYKRMRCGFEDNGVLRGPFESTSAKVMGNLGEEVTAVLANSPGALQLLPSNEYGNGWLQVKHKDHTLKLLPQKGDPYEEIYKLKGKWYGLLREEWINPAKDLNGGFVRTARYLDQAKEFHKAIANTYHEPSYGHYGADPEYKTWDHVVWEIDAMAIVPDVETLAIATDNKKGTLQLHGKGAITRKGREVSDDINVTLQSASEPGDQTVPLHSADQQRLLSHKFKGIFRQTGYDHQGSYQNEKALNSTLYCVVRIAQTMTWNT